MVELVSRFLLYWVYLVPADVKIFWGAALGLLLLNRAGAWWAKGEAPMTEEEKQEQEEEFNTY